MTISLKSQEILHKNKRYIPGGIVSTNRTVEPSLVFSRAQGASLWDVDGKKYIDYHAAFGPYILGHNDEDVNQAVIASLSSGASLFGSGTNELEGELAELICESIPCVDSIQLLNTGSEATYQAIRLARAQTGKSHVIKPQGGYHGWHNDVALNLMTPLEKLGPYVSPGEYPKAPISAGIPEEHTSLIHAVNYNDLASVEWVCQHYPVAAMILEPILQNIGVVKPVTGYLEGLRVLADRYGFLLIFDEVKTGFRHALGGYATVSGVTPDLVVYGKAVANGFPLAVLGGKRGYMDMFVTPDPARRVLLAGTYNGHPVPVAAAIATIRKLARNHGEIYDHLEALGARMQTGLEKIFREQGIVASVSRQCSAFSCYFMEGVPRNWHELVSHHDFAFDLAWRRQLVERGVYFLPLPVKQCSLSSAHTEQDIDFTLEQVSAALKSLAHPVA
jgi:glutamate-1-semialdehyde 2,1-aminomutase